ncbi:hypothetical protein O0L34_g17830 [Tuta absoluta]|nr:hypothetical protein O0L34_g17830 [Tuta absoluta]
MDLGDQRPSQLLRRMKELARDRIEDKTLLILWQNHLPVWVRGVLAVSDIKDLTKLALMADKVMENARPVQVASVDETPGMSTSSTSNIIAEINKLGERIKNIENLQRRNVERRHEQQTRPRSRSGARQRFRSPSQGPSGDKKNNPNWLCFYHFRYNTKAHKCVQPCNWKKEQNPEN